jgi:hypothetical protein
VFVLIQACTATHRANYGTGFLKKGYIYMSTDRHYMFLVFQIPTNQGVPPNWQTDLDCPVPNEYDTLSVEICQAYSLLVKTHKQDLMQLSNNLQGKIDDIWKVLPKETTPTTRDKRALPLLPIFSVISGIARWVNSYLMRRKISALGTAVNELAQANYEIENKVIKVHDELISLT